MENNMGIMDSNINLMEMAEQVRSQGELVYESVKYVTEMARDVEKTAMGVKKVGEFVVDFYNEYRQHDALTMGQVEELKEAQHAQTTKFVKILFPNLVEDRTRGSEYLKEWIKVNRGLWSIFKRNVNGNSIPYSRTPKVKYEQALEYLNELTVGDYLALRDGRFRDIQKFKFDESLVKDRLTIEDVVNNVVSRGD